MPPEACVELRFLLETVNLKPDSVDGSCFLLPQFFKAFEEDREAFLLG